MIEILSECCKSPITIGKVLSTCDKCGSYVNSNTGKLYSIRVYEFIESEE